jgi:hypothetical protein
VASSRFHFEHANKETRAGVDRVYLVDFSFESVLSISETSLKSQDEYCADCQLCFKTLML